jgi:galactose mutarotase-like enzyme
MPTIISTRWLIQPALAIEDDTLRVVIVPDMGAKIVSIFDKRRSLEWLAGPGKRAFKPAPYAAVFTDQDMSGWDEMFPTISACPYPQPGQYHGAALPDHGEVWCLPWKTRAQASGGESGACLTSTVQGKALPYRLERRLSLPEPGVLLMEYTFENLTGERMPYLWSAHPQLLTGDNARVILPDNVSKVMNVLPIGFGWGAPEEPLAWPETHLPGGTVLRPAHIAGPDLKQARKFFTFPDQRPAWCAVERLNERTTLRLEWDPAQAPYLGVWADEGYISAFSVAAPEPMTGFYDSLERAVANEKVMWAEAGEVKNWWLRVKVT